MDALFTPKHVLLLASLLFCVGMYGVLARRNLLIMLLSLELMMVSVNVALVLFSRMHGAELITADTPGVTIEAIDIAFRSAHTGQFFALMTMTVAAGEVGVGLAIAVALYRTNRTLDTDEANELRY